MAEPNPLTSSQLVAAATEYLLAGGYSRVEVSAAAGGTSRVFEDPFGVVAVHVYDTWDDLYSQWNEAQGSLVELMSAHLRQREAKSWEGYLVLLCSSPSPTSERNEVSNLRHDTNRVRKLVATGDELETLEDVRTALLPLLPLEVNPPGPSGAGLLDRLPELLRDYGVDPQLTRVVVDAFISNDSIIERIHESRTTP